LFFELFDKTNNFFYNEINNSIFSFKNEIFILFNFFFKEELIFLILITYLLLISLIGSVYLSLKIYEHKKL
jgi:hypothetical protein